MSFMISAVIAALTIVSVWCVVEMYRWFENGR